MNKELWATAKAYKIAQLIIDLVQAQIKGDYFKAIILHIELQQVKASTYPIQGETA